jgi:hypothetical protein
MRDKTLGRVADEIERIATPDLYPPLPAEPLRSLRSPHTTLAGNLSLSREALPRRTTSLRRQHKPKVEDAQAEQAERAEPKSRSQTAHTYSLSTSHVVPPPDLEHEAQNVSYHRHSRTPSLGSPVSTRLSRSLISHHTTATPSHVHVIPDIELYQGTPGTPSSVRLRLSLNVELDTPTKGTGSTRSRSHSLSRSPSPTPLRNRG